MKIAEYKTPVCRLVSNSILEELFIVKVIIDNEARDRKIGRSLSDSYDEMKYKNDYEIINFIQEELVSRVSFKKEIGYEDVIESIRSCFKVGNVLYTAYNKIKENKTYAQFIIRGGVINNSHAPRLLDKISQIIGETEAKDEVVNYYEIRNVFGSPGCIWGPNVLEAKCMIDSIKNFQNSIWVGISVDTNKRYNNNSIAKCSLWAFTGIQELFNEKPDNLYWADNYYHNDDKMYFLTQSRWTSGGFSFNKINKSKVNLFCYKSMIVFWDGIQSFAAVRPYFEQLYQLGVRDLRILQFCSGRKLFFDRRNSSIRSVTMRFVNKDKINLGRSEFSWERSSCDGVFFYQPIQNGKTYRQDVYLRGGNTVSSFVIVPVDSDGIQTQFLAEYVDLMRMMSNACDDSQIIAQEDKIEKLLYGNTKINGDILSDWFYFCTTDIKRTDDAIIQSYKNMKLKLEKEYSEIQKYMKFNDFKLEPIPAVKSDRKLQKNYYKSFQIDRKDIIIKTINDKKIKTITRTIPAIQFIDRHNLTIGTLPLEKYLDKKNNVINLSFTHLKGAVHHAKTKNR